MATLAHVLDEIERMNNLLDKFKQDMGMRFQRVEDCLDGVKKQLDGIENQLYTLTGENQIIDSRESE